MLGPVLVLDHYPFLLFFFFFFLFIFFFFCSHDIVRSVGSRGLMRPVSRKCSKVQSNECAKCPSVREASIKMLRIMLR